ncbi:MAG: response regulator transcription factor, partial [Nitrospinota bacterium]
MARIVLLSLDGGTTEQMVRLLRGGGHQVATASDAETGLSLLKSKDPGLVALDLHPELPSLEELRRFCEGPLLAIAPLERVGALPSPLPADDLIAKPIRPAELLFRVRRLLAASERESAPGGLEVAGLHIDDPRYEVRLDGELIDLTYREYELLKYLMTNRGRVLNREHLLNMVWGATT